MATPSIADLLNLKERVAFVTGAAQGIGRAIAERLGEAGAHVAVADTNQTEAAATVAAIRQAGGSAESVLVDITSSAAVQSGIDNVCTSKGRLDILVNNAGIYPMRTFAESDDALWQKTLDVNVMGTMRCCRAAVPHMQKSGGGTIVNLASIAGLKPEYSHLAHYETSKGAVLMMTRSLAWELRASRIRVNAVAPGGVQTPGARQSIEPLLADPKKLMERSREFMSRIALKRMGEPDDVARAVLFLASPMADYITGATLLVDGGYLLS